MYSFKSVKYDKLFIGTLILLSLGVDKYFANEVKKDDFISPPGIEYTKKKPLQDYIIGEGDLIRIIISRDLPNLSNIYEVDSSGMVYLPMLNRVYISGLTITEANNILTERLKEFVKQPAVEIEIARYRPISIYVDGEVQSPGLYNLLGSSTNTDLSFPLTSTSTNNILSDSSESNTFGVPQVRSSKVFNLRGVYPTLYDAIRKAGGINNYSDMSNIKVIRINSISNGGNKISSNINFLSFINDGNSSQNIRIYDGDIIKINKSKYPLSKQISKAIRSNLNPKFISVFIAGRVIQPGLLRVSKSSTLNDALEVAGGVRVLSGPISFTRFESDGKLDKRKFAYNSTGERGSFKNPYLRDGDIIRVTRSPFNVTTEIIKEVTGPFVGLYSTMNLVEDFFED